MDINYKNVKEKIGDYLKLEALTQEQRDDLVNFHRQIELYNAHKTIANEDDKIMKDVQFLISSAIFLFNIGKPGDWRLQLEAAFGILESSKMFFPYPEKDTKQVIVNDSI